METMKLDPKVKKALQAKLEEEEKTKKTRRKMKLSDFETLTIIGRGAFGEVSCKRASRCRC
jgi:hypothetical protein